MAKSTFPGYPADTIPFLRELSNNNDRDWFASQKTRYEATYIDPSIALMESLVTPMKRISPFLEVKPTKSRGSLLRIYRDTRFAKDKTPYKTHIGMQFRHEAGCDIHAPGAYLHIQPGQTFLAAGIWHPDRDPLLWIRQKIAAEPREWKQILQAKAFQAEFTMEGDSLTRPPKGFDTDHEAIEEIKRKDFIAVSPLQENAITRSDFPELIIKKLRLTNRLMMFLCEALELSY
ncbi:MAG: TIGR02453 family protein [Planctomycetaceae bacterium]|nr:TIGR02453 family protein [Planctomycetaceae bacterium]